MKRTRTELVPYEQRAARKRRPPTKFLINDRRRQGMLLKIAGASCEEIGLALHADERVNVRGISVEGGYGWRTYLNGDDPPVGLRLSRLVSQDLNKGWDEVEIELAEARRQYRTLELARLDAAQKAIWTRVEQGNDWAIDRFLGIVDRRMRLLGLEAPTKIETKSELTVDTRVGVQPEVDPEFTAGVQTALRELQSALTPPESEVLEGEAVGDDIVGAEIVEPGSDG